MTDPAVVTIPANTWVKVSTNVKLCHVVGLKFDNVKYVQTYRDTGTAAPTNGDLTDAKEMSYNGVQFDNSDRIDCYVAVATGSGAGLVRVEL